MSTNRCICCGEEIPEGLMICPACQKKSEIKHNTTKQNDPECKEDRFTKLMDAWIVPLLLAVIVIIWIVKIATGTT